MLKNKKNDVAFKMLTEFEKQLNFIFEEYHQKKHSTEKCINSLNWLRNAWSFARLDIKNHGKHNQVRSFTFSEDIDIAFPGWFNDEKGQGARIHLKKANTDISFQCVNNGLVKFNFRGIDYRFNNKRHPIYFNYVSVRVNNTELLKEDRIAWHDKAFYHTTKCKNNQIVTVKIKLENIYDYYPSLKSYLMNIKNKEDLDNTYEDITEFIDIEKKLLQYDKNESEIDQILESKLYLLNKQNDELFLELEEYKKQTNDVLDSYNLLFNNILKFNKIEPKRLVKLSRELNMQLLDFIDNICKKHKLQWWLYGGTLLGAIRHGGFIPWDDDCDIKMMREDYEKFLDIIDDEIKEHNLSGFMEANTTTKTVNGVLLPFIKLNYWVNKHLFAFTDIFPTDYLKDEKAGTKKNFEVETRRMIGRLSAGEDRRKVIADSSKNMGVSKTKTDKVICGIEDSIFAVHNYNTIFPLTTIKFENREYPCPLHYYSYVKELYGDDYMEIPKLIYAHGFYDYLSMHNDVYNKMEENIKKLEKINENF